MNHFLPADLSAKLSKLGVMSEFGTHRCSWGNAQPHEPDFEYCSPIQEQYKAIHVFDLIGNVENAKIVFGDKRIEEGRNFTFAYLLKSHELLSLIQSNGDYETYIRKTMVK